MKVPGLGWVTADTAHRARGAQRPGPLHAAERGRRRSPVGADPRRTGCTSCSTAPATTICARAAASCSPRRRASTSSSRAWGERIQDARARFDAGEAIDLADLSRMLVGQMVVMVLQDGPVVVAEGGTVDDAYRDIFAIGEGKLASRRSAPPLTRCCLPRRSRARGRSWSGSPATSTAALRPPRATRSLAGVGLAPWASGDEGALDAVHGRGHRDRGVGDGRAGCSSGLGEQHALIANPKLMEGAVREALGSRHPRR